MSVILVMEDVKLLVLTLLVATVVHAMLDMNLTMMYTTAMVSKCCMHNSHLFDIEIDECHRGTDLCEHNCTNTAGSYNCSCVVGYYLETNNHNCTGTTLECIICIFMCHQI